MYWYNYEPFKMIYKEVGAHEPTFFTAFTSGAAWLCKYIFLFLVLLFIILPSKLFKVVWFYMILSEMDLFWGASTLNTHGLAFKLFRYIWINYSVLIYKTLNNIRYLEYPMYF